MNPAPYQFPNQTSFYKGKVRDVYGIGDHLLMITSDRISAFDVVLPRAIPYKGQVLNLIAAHYLEATKDIVPNWLDEVPHPNVSVGTNAKPFAIEMIVRAYLAGSMNRDYKDGQRVFWGVTLPDGLKENDKLHVKISKLKK